MAKIIIFEEHSNKKKVLKTHNQLKFYLIISIIYNCLTTIFAIAWLLGVK